MSIIINNLKKYFNKELAIDIPTLNIPDGQFVGLLGFNGSGKTTFFRLLLDLIDASSGTISIDQYSVASDPSWKQFTGSYLDESFLIDYYYPEEFLKFVADVYGFGEQELAARLERYRPLMIYEIFGQHKLIHQLSMGNRQKIGVISAMIAQPDLLLLDEPFNYLDFRSQNILAEILSEMNNQGTTIIISSHNLQLISNLCTRFIVLESGKIIIDNNHTQHMKDDTILEYFKKT